MSIEFGDAQDAYKFLTNRKWVVFNYGNLDDGFIAFFEKYCFPPSTKKNAEFEIAVIPLKSGGERKTSCWIRFLDTTKNRQAFADAMELYYHKPLPKDWAEKLEIMRNQLELELEVKGEILSFNEGKTQ